MSDLQQECTDFSKKLRCTTKF